MLYFILFTKTSLKNYIKKVHVINSKNKKRNIMLEKLKKSYKCYFLHFWQMCAEIWKILLDFILENFTEL